MKTNMVKMLETSKSGERIDCIDWLWLGDVVDINLEIRMVFIGAGTLFDKNGHMT